MTQEFAPVISMVRRKAGSVEVTGQFAGNVVAKNAPLRCQNALSD
jgi:hypothetical protein